MQSCKLSVSSDIMVNGLWTQQSAARQTHLCPSQPQL